MATAGSTSITVRVQAKGGKFLADTGTGTATFFIKQAS